MTLPTFLVIGASRSGTTSLHHYLGQHPEIHMSPVKSPNFFVSADPQPAWEGPLQRAMARQWISDRASYEALFAGAARGQAVGEVSPVYLQSLHAPARIHDACPDAKLVAVLRDPVERAWAHYLGRRRDGLESRPDFGEVVEAELRQPPPDPVAFGSYLGGSRYHRFLHGYFERFPRERIRVYLFDELVADAGALLADLFGFLGVDPTIPLDLEHRHNQTGMVRGRLRRALWTGSVRLRIALRPYLPPGLRAAGRLVVGRELERPPLDPALRSRIASALAPDLERLESLLDRDLGCWRGDP